MLSGGVRMQGIPGFQPVYIAAIVPSRGVWSLFVFLSLLTLLSPPPTSKNCADSFSTTCGFTETRCSLYGYYQKRYKSRKKLSLDMVF